MSRETTRETRIVRSGRRRGPARHGGIAAVLALASLAGGCAELTSGGFGEAEAYLAGDAPPRSDSSGPSAAAASGAPAAGSDGAPAATSASRTDAARSIAPVDGEAALDASVTVGVRVFLRSGFGEWIELTLGTQTITVPATGPAEVLVTRRMVAADLYSGVRVLFSRIDADVRGGLIVDGLPIVGEVRVDASVQDPVEIEAAVDLVVEDDGVAAVLIDLNAPVWLGTASAIGRIVGRAAFTAAVEVERR